ncbi:MAG: MogA/MoaB family molybdenum cofactor biosynthesis protein [Trueperaceae bacterium]
MIRTAILAVNDRGATAERVVSTVEKMRVLLMQGPFQEVDFQVVPDEQSLIRSRLRILSERPDVDLVLTTGGTGLSFKERTPEATKEVIERDIPGIPEMIRLAGFGNSYKAAMFRGVCGIRRKCLIVNLPGGPKGVEDTLKAIYEVLQDMVARVQGEEIPV